MAAPDLSAIQAKANADPALQQALQIYRSHNGDPRFLSEDLARIDQAATAAGIQIPNGYGFSATGEIKERSWLDRHGMQLGIGLLGAGSLGGLALGAGGGGGAAAAPAAGTGGAATGGAAGTTAATAAGGSSLLHALLPSIIGAGAQIGGTAIASHASTEAAKLQAEQADKALALQKEQYALQRQDTAPYRALGQGAVGNLGYLSGINVDEKVPELSATVPKVPYGQQAPSASLSILGAPPAASQASFQMMRAPNGLVVKVPTDKVAEATQRGGVPVNG